MGILDPKEIVMDTILTNEGRRQIAHSSLRASYYSFTDTGAIYSTDTIVSGTLSAGGLPFNETYRLCFEASNLPQDTIVYETDDSGKLNAIPPNVSLDNGNQIAVRSGKIFEITGSNRVTEIVDQDTFASLSQGVISSSLNAFKNQLIISSPDPMDDTERGFIIGPSSVNWSITDERPIAGRQMQEADIDAIESLFFDKRLSHVPNFQFLVPVNKGTNGTEPIGNYIPINQAPILQYDPDISDELKKYENIGYGQTINFTETSRENNIFIQLFETGKGSIGKLDIVDFGAFETVDENGNTITKHVFFCGKVYTDNLGANTFVNLFTIVFDGNAGVTL